MSAASSPDAIEGMDAAPTGGAAAVTAPMEASPPPRAGAGWRLNVLGPVELCYDGRPVEVTGPTRTLLALIARSPGEETSSTDLVAGLWGDQPPEDAEKEVASHVSRLRKALTVVAPNVDPTRVIVTLPAGYILDIQPSNADTIAFERLTADGRRALAVGEPELALIRLDAALALWRGTAYEDFGDHAFARAEAARLEELRLTAVECRVQARLAVAAPGVPDGLEAELRALIIENWYRERLWVLLMTALFRLGRRGDALAVCRQAQERLATAPGGATGPDLREAERAVIASDPVLFGVARAPVAVPLALAHPGPACVGRGEEIAWLLSAVDLAATRRAQARLIVGGPGIGKTRLVAEIARRAAARGISTRYWRAGVPGLESVTAEPDRVSLVVLDDLDQATHDDLVAATNYVRATRAHPVVVLVTCRDPVRVGDLHGVPKLVLAALDDEAVAEIVRVYAPSTATATAAAAMVNAGGVPARVHRYASEWAFQRAGRRIDRAVADAQRPRRWLDAVETEVVGGVLDLAYVRDRARALHTPARPTVERPYVGPARFSPAQSEVFYGRERLVADALARLVRAPLLALVGPSGVGKSSLVRAGLLPALAAGVLPDSGRWHQVLITPTTVAGSLAEHLAAVDAARIAALEAEFEAGAEAEPDSAREDAPVVGLEDQPDATAGGEPGEAAGEVAMDDPVAAGPVLLIVDSFDEVFSALGPAERDGFLATVVATAATGRVVLTLRPSTYARCVEHPDLARLVGANTLLVPAMTPDEVRAAVRRPAAMAGLEFEAGVAEQITADALASPGDLTGLSCALYATWLRRAGRTLTASGYAATGGVARSVEVFAEEIYAALTTAERDVARTILLHLCAGGSTTDLAGVLTAAGPGGSAVLEKLAERGLLRLTDSDRVELIHPILAKRWSRLRGWLDQSAAEADLHAHLRQAAAGWAGSGRATADLYRGARLVTALDWASARAAEVSPVEREFLHAGERLALAGENRRRRRIVLLWKWLAATLVVAILAVAVATFAVIGQLRADAAARRAEAVRVATIAAAEPDLRLALLLAVAAADLDPGVGAIVRDVLSRAPDLIAMAGESVSTVAVSPDGRWVAAGRSDGTVHTFAEGSLAAESAALAGGPAPVRGLTFTADGRRLIGWGGDTDPARSGIAVWDLATGEPVAPTFGDRPLGAGGGLAGDGVTLLVAPPGAAAMPWNIDARTPSTTYQLPSDPVETLALSRDGRSAVFGGPAGASVVVVETGETAKLPAVRALALSADGSALLSAQGPEVVVWSVADRAEVGRANVSRADITAAAWSPDGRGFASAAADGTITVWDATTRRPVRVLTGHGVAAHTVAYASNGRALYSVGADGAVVAWDLSGVRGLGARQSVDAVPADLVRLACASAGRDLSREEWARFLPGRGFQPVCPD